ncbi:MAG: undecaprenyl-diphosphate phosphatase [Saprospiraceae bacterium]|nr:undecaprenyl-diphosphate phosphatase [Saprospiraceae bacterium]
METIEAIILGIVQGLTEFLPVSSSGHLEIGKYILGDTAMGEESLVMTVTLHAATALSTIVIFRKDIAKIFAGLFEFKANDSFWYSVKIVISMIPAAAIGLFFEDLIESLFSQKLMLVGSLLLITGILLFLADRAKTTTKGVGFLNSFLIGLAQAVAILPGISRSGATIATSVLLGIDRSESARFSFLMVIPLILGKMAKDLLSGDISLTGSQAVPLLAGFVAAFLTGLVACTWMIRLVKASKLSYFAYYCFVVGVFAILWIAFKG